MPFYARPSLKATVIRNESGLTLLEVIASLSLLAILLGVLTQFLYAGLRVKEKTDQAYERQHLLKNFHQTVSADLASLVVGPYLPENAVSGDDYEMNFWQESNNGLLQIRYRYDLQEKRLLRATCFWGGKPEETVIFTDITKWKIEYFRFKTKNWLTVWKPSHKDEIPALIRFTLATKNADLGELVFPIKVWYNEELINGF